MAVHDFRSQRLFVDHELASGASFEVTREQANYLLNVLRLGADDHILVFNGRDGEWKALVEPQGRKKCMLKPVECIRVQPTPYDLVYCFAPLKKARLDYMVQKAVEMGAGVLQPVITEYTQVRSINHDRLLANAIEAAEQCGILSLPEIREPVPLNELAQALGNKTTIIFCDEENNHSDSLADVDASSPLALLIGPEGGFSPREREFVRSLENSVSLGLGPRILRADTAAVAALAIIQARLGDWYPKD